METALHKAVLAGNLECVKLLVKNKADVNIRNKHGETCLHFAARNGSLEISKLLLENNIDYTVVGEHGLAKV
ncbi:hypothetical protein HMI54_011810 [Coelomomyces lativittatus]|nr:hypothetical protein HMI54_011810 [Coelomomyces lativittatus]